MSLSLRLRVGLVLVIVLLVAAGAAASAAPASRPSIVVTKTSDSYDGACDNDCSLREAIEQANTTAGPDTITLGAGTYTLSIPGQRDDDGDLIDETNNAIGDLDIASRLTIVGSGAGRTSVYASRLDRAFDLLPNASATLRELTITGGAVSTVGGGLRNAGALTLERVLVTDNRAASSLDIGHGGGIFNAGTLTIRRSVISNNGAFGGEASYGFGGGVFNTGTLRVVNTTIADNMTSDDNDTGGGGGLFNLGNAEIVGSTFSGNSTSVSGSGGAIANRDGATLTMTNSTVSGNQSGELFGGGGAIANGEQGDFGAAPGSVRLDYVTVADNRGGGLINSGSATLVSTIVAGNPDASGNYHGGVNCLNVGPSFGMASVSLLLGDDGNCVGDIYVDNASALGTVFGRLAANGGPTRTHALRRGSPAIGASQANCPATDQRGVARPQQGCDIGAYERAGAASGGGAPTSTPAPISTPAPTSTPG